jgi:ornithine--oxo-acid transaminase
MAIPVERNYLIDEEQKVTAHYYHPLPVVLSHGRGSWVWDILGKRYLDLMSAYSAVSLGHGHPKILQAMFEQAQRLCVPSRAYYNDRLAPFLQKLCEVSKMDMAAPMNSGSEAVETAIKAARQWGYLAKGIEKYKAEIIVAENNFHGRTTTIVGFSSDSESKDNFGPYAPGFVTVPFGNASAIEAAITQNTCAVLIEPIQGEAGVIVPPEGYLRQVKDICQRNNVLFILDEVQSGLGRTGKMFAFQHEDAKPDGLILGKALGGGVMAVSAFLARKDVMELFTKGSHGSTFGGNPLAAAIGLTALKVLETEGLVQKSQELGNYLMERLQQIQSPAIKEIRGKGLWIGIELDPKIITGRQVAEKMLDKGILTKETHETTLRIAPPLIITKEEIDWAVEQLASCLTVF